MSGLGAGPWENAEFVVGTVFGGWEGNGGVQKKVWYQKQNYLNPAMFN